jgi:protein-tyrosine phosphatase
VDCTQITDTLFVGTMPESADYDALRDLGVQLVINMRFERRLRPDPHDPPLSFLWLPTIDHPLFPIPLRSLRRGADAALDMIQAGGNVYTCCHAGVHRSVAMAAVILIAQGYPADEAMALIKVRRKVADPYVWYIRWRINRFAASWENQQCRSIHST